MELVIKDGEIIAYYRDGSGAAALHPDCEVFEWSGPFQRGPIEREDGTLIHPKDPRTKDRRDAMIADKPRTAFRRRLAAMSTKSLLMHLYTDRLNGTDTFGSIMSVICDKYPVED